MQFWFVHSGKVPLREQIVTQILLGIASGELLAGDRLPSTRELARRFKLHPNTVSAAYRRLESEGKVELRHGSGVFVRATGTLNRAKEADPVSPANGDDPDRTWLDRMIAMLLSQARERGLESHMVRERLRQWIEVEPPECFLVVEPDEELRRIVVAEVRMAVGFPVKSCGLEEWCSRLADSSQAGTAAVVFVLPSKAESVRKLLPVGSEMVILQVRSVPVSLAEWLPAPAGALVGIASRWPEFLKLAKTMLVATGLDGESLVVRDARQTGWQRGLEQTLAVVCDVVAREGLPRTVKAIPFRLLADASVLELGRMETSIRSRLDP